MFLVFKKVPVSDYNKIRGGSIVGDSAKVTRERERQTDRQRDRQTERETEREKYAQNKNDRKICNWTKVSDAITRLKLSMPIAVYF